MGAFGKASDMLGAMRASADGAWKSLSKKSPETPNPSPAFTSPDPTRAFYPNETAETETPGALPLSTLLEDSAHAIVRRKEDLLDLARGLAHRIEDRRAGELTLATQAVRVLIGLVWLGVALWLYNAMLVARADGFDVLANGMPVADAAILMRSFFMLAAAGLAVAFGVAAIVRVLGKADNTGIRREAEQLGASIAAAASEFDNTLSSLRGAMDRRGHPADAVDDLSRAHLTALEAHAFFREIEFLTGPEDAHAQRMFKGFLARAGAGPAGGIAFLAFLIGIIVGAAFMHVAVAPEPEPVTEAKTALAIAQYPWAAQLIILGGLAYAFIGIGLSLVGGPLTGAAAETARREALTALRSGFSTDNALRPADITRRIRDAVDVFRARIGGRGASPSSGASHTRTERAEANHSTGFDAEDDVPEWRRRDSSVKFVETGFSAAPSSFRTDAFAKKFTGADGRKTGSKRGGEALKNRPCD